MSKEAVFFKKNKKYEVLQSFEGFNCSSDYKGDEYQWIEYTPYGETWVEKTQNTGLEYLPYKFTGKEIDEETGLYYYGARYLDPKYSRWISTDPALGEYIPQAPISDESQQHNSNLPGMGGVYNSVNLHLYHYAGNNPVRYIDPDGRVTKHKDLKGRERLKSELKDIVQGSFKFGIFAGGSITLWGIVDVGAEVNLGSAECSGSFNNDVKTTESAGLDLELGALDFLKGNINLKVEREVSKDAEIGNYFQMVKDIITEGEFSPDVGAKLGPLSTSAEDEDVKFGGEIGFCVGIGLWINLSEIKDFVKGWMNGEY